MAHNATAATKHHGTTLSKSQRSEILLQAFRAADPTGSGTISIPKFKRLFMKLDPNMDVNGLLDTAGHVLDFSHGHVNYENFIHWAAGDTVTSKHCEAPKLGVLRLDYNYPPAPGDIDHPDSFGYEVVFRVVPGLTFERCQEGKLSYQTQRNLLDAVRDMEKHGASGIAGDCGFMMWYQPLVRLVTDKPVFMSSLASLPAIVCGFGHEELIAIFTANGKSLAPMRDLIKEECGIDPGEKRFVIVGCEDIPGFEAVEQGEKVDVAKVTPGMIKKAKSLMKARPKLRAIFMECTELPAYSDALRAATGLPVWDAITSCDFFISGRVDNARFGMDFESRKSIASSRHSYHFGSELTAEQKKQVVSKMDSVKKYDPKDDILEYTGPSKHAAASLGVIRLDYDYPPAPGDIDCPDSFSYDVFYRVVPGLTFEMCQSGKIEPRVLAEFKEAVRYLETRGVSGITGDCGFMMWFQEIARELTTHPVFMSALAQLPAITCSFSKNEKIAIFTANGKTLAPMHDLIKEECGVDPEEARFIIVGCEDVSGFEAVAAGEKVDVEKVTPGMITLARKMLVQHPDIRALLLECTELPPYADALRASTGLPVYDSITCCNFFISGRQDNVRFGVNNWQEEWDGVQDEYQFGANLRQSQKARLVNTAKA